MYRGPTRLGWITAERAFPELRRLAGISTSFNPSRVIPRRYLYPNTEVNTNNQPMTAAIERQGGQLLDVDMWAFK